MMQGERKWRASGVAFILILAALVLGACQVHYTRVPYRYSGSQAYDGRQSYFPIKGIDIAPGMTARDMCTTTAIAIAALTGAIATRNTPR